MLSLDDSRWTELTHAYGPASDVPALIRQLADNPAPKRANEPWFSLWSCLCHQGDVYTASYAAIPHIVQIALTTPGSIDFSFFQLTASVEVARVNGLGPDIPPFLALSYAEAIKALPDCVSAHLTEDWDQDMTICIAAALAVAKGQHVLAEALMNLDGDLISRINSGEWD
jgi:hypothetical protein